MVSGRNLPSFLELSTHTDGAKPCLVCTTVAVATVQPAGGAHYASLVIDQPGRPIASAIFLNRQELEAIVILLGNAIDDAERIDAGLRPRHALGSGAQN